MKKGVYYLLAGLLACLGLTLACRWLAGQVDWKKAWDELDGGTYSIPEADAAYEFNPRVVSTALPPGEFLTPVPLLRSTPTPDVQAVPVTLSDDVLYGIASRLVEREEMGEPELEAVSFELHCTNVGLGPRFVSFAHVRLVDEALSFPYLVEYVGINVEGGRASYRSYRETSRSPSVGRTAIDYSGLPIRIYEALQIAENSGGREFRNSVNNACVIRGGLGGYGKADEWRVGYVVGGEKPEWAFEIEIDAVSGEVRSLR